MLNNVKWNYVLVVTIITFFILISGWYLYTNMTIIKPIQTNLNLIEGVEVNNVDLTKESVDINLSLTDIDNFQSTYYQIEDTVSSYLNTRSLSIEIENKENQEIISAWSKSYFYIAEALETNQYSLIPKAIEDLKENSNLDNAGYFMDNKNIYIDLHQGEESYFFIIPLGSYTEVNSLG